MFRLSPAELQTRMGCFAVRRGQLDRRLDHYYYLPEFEIAVSRLRAAQFRPVELTQVALQITDGTHYTPVYVDVGIPFVSAKDVDEFAVSLNVTRFVSEAEHKIFTRRCNPEPGDVLLSKIGTIGRAAVVPADAPVFDLFVSVCLIKPNRTLVLPEYLCAVLNTSLARTQFSRALKGIGVPDLHLEDIRQTLIPLPSPPIQERLVNLLDQARASWRSKLDEAESLIASQDPFVLNSLGLIVQQSNGRAVYAVRRRDARLRFDPDYNSPIFRTLRAKIDDGRFPAQSVASLFYPIVSGFAAGSDDQTDDTTLGVPHIRPLNITNTGELTFEGTKMVPRSALAPGDYLRKGEILFNNTNSTVWVGKSVVFDADRDCACANHITRLTLIDQDQNPYYFAALFNALRGLGYFGLLSTNFNNQAGINAETLKAVRLPVPNSKTQEEIATEIALRRDKAHRLCDEAHKIWDEAKSRFEKELLGPEKGMEETRIFSPNGGRKR